MKKFILLSISLCFVLNLAASSKEDLYKRAVKEREKGNYKDALKMFKEIVLEKDNSSKKLCPAFNCALECMRNLNMIKDNDAFRERAIAIHKDNWKFLQTAAQSLLREHHHGYMIAGQFERGSHRGGGEIVNAIQRDRIRALQLYFQAMPLVKENAKACEKYSFYRTFASAILYDRGYSEAWRLQYLSDLEKLPDYEPGYYWRHGGNFGAPVNEDGDPIYYSVPESFDAARSDGQRWRWFLKEAQRIYH